METTKEKQYNEFVKIASKLISCHQRDNFDEDIALWITQEHQGFSQDYKVNLIVEKFTPFKQTS